MLDEITNPNDSILMPFTFYLVVTCVLFSFALLPFVCIKLLLECKQRRACWTRPQGRPRASCRQLPESYACWTSMVLTFRETGKAIRQVQAFNSGSRFRGAFGANWSPMTTPRLCENVVRTEIRLAFEGHRACRAMMWSLWSRLNVLLAYHSTSCGGVHVYTRQLCDAIKYSTQKYVCVYVRMEREAINDPKGKWPLAIWHLPRTRKEAYVLHSIFL